MSEPLSVVEYFQQSWAKYLSDFRGWMSPNTKAMLHWKTRTLKEAIAACPSRMVDSAMEMWEQWRKHQDNSSSVIPVMLTAFEAVPTMPLITDIRAVPEWTKVILPNDPQQRVVQMRTVSMKIRAQLVFFAPTPHDIAWFVTQFVNYARREEKHYLSLNIQLGDGISEEWPLMIINNQLDASTVPLNEKNLLACRIDVYLEGSIPEVVGLGETVDTIVDVANRPTAEQLQYVVVEADLHSEERHVRWVAEADNEPYLITLTLDQLLRLENSGGTMLLINGKYLRLWSE